MFADAVRNEPRVTIRRGVQAVELVTGPSVSDGTPHVAGVRTADGETLRSDLVVDAMGHSDTEAWTNTVRACPMQAHWLDGEPISDVLAMSGIVDRYRRFVVDGSPVVTGLVPVADAWGCTNPSAGRGLTVGLQHGVALRDVLRTTADEPSALVREFDARTETDVAPWFHAQIAVDRARYAQIEALCEGRERPMPADELSSRCVALLMAMTTDPDLFCAALEYIGTLTPIQALFERPGVAERVRTAMRDSGPMELPGPSRAELLDLVR